MGPKKEQRNAFYFFMVKHRNDQNNQGRYITLTSAAKEARFAWEQMGPEERQVYKEQADKYKIESKMEKYNSYGTAFSELKKMQQEKEQKKYLMDITIKEKINHLDRNSTLKTCLFHLIHINYFCETAEHKFLPAEIAIATFNLEKGVVDTFHRYVNIGPGNIPMGYRHEANEHTNATHQLPFFLENGESDMNRLFVDIKTFIKPEGTTGELPPLYTMPDNVDTNTSESAVKSVLGLLAENRDEDPDMFRVFHLPKLFLELRNACSESPVFPSQSIAESELEKDVFNYTTGIACSFHEENDLMQFCSLSVVRRWVFLICDHCCKDLYIRMQPGSHCPKSADVEENYRQVWSRRSGERGNGQDNHRSQNSNRGAAKVPSDRPASQKANSFVSIAQIKETQRSASACQSPSEDRAPSTRRAKCWSSVADRSSTSSLPPSLDDENYPSISSGRGSSASNSSFNSWGGRGRGYRGFNSRFQNMNLDN